MNLIEAQSALAVQKDAFQEVVQRPNCLERNVILAEHRAEMARLQKFIDKTPTRKPATRG